MASLLQAMQAYGPKLELNQTAQLNEVADWMAMRTGLNKSEASAAFNLPAGASETVRVTLTLAR